MFFCIIAGQVTAKRYGLFIAKNNGGKGRPVLRYAQNDVHNLRATLAETGNLKVENSILLIEPDIAKLRSALQRFSQMLAREKNAREVFFYYSGHSDERGLLIDNAVLDFAELKKWISELPSEVNIVILDSCSSGSLARLKGGKQVASTLLADTVNHRGTAILASSSSSEDSQESDQLRGSYFTHNLIAGLRGAADLNRDQIVSLYEAYTYSYEETLASTLDSRAGPQHPFFDFKVSGQGDLPLSDLRQSASQLVFGDDILGKIYIFDGNNCLSLKVHKTSAKPLLVRLNPDRFQIRIFHEKNITEAAVELLPNQARRLNAGQFSALPVSTTIEPRLRYNSDFFLAALFGPSFHYFMPASGSLRGIDLADLGYTGRVNAGLKIREDTALFMTGAVSGISNLTKSSGNTNPMVLNLGLGARYHFYPSGFFIGGSANAAWNRISVTQDFGAGRETLTYMSGLGFGIDLNAGFEWMLARNLGLGISWFSYFGTVYGSGSDPRLTADQVQNVVIGLMVSLTFF